MKTMSVWPSYSNTHNDVFKTLLVRLGLLMVTWNWMLLCNYFYLFFYSKLSIDKDILVSTFAPSSGARLLYKKEDMEKNCPLDCLISTTKKSIIIVYCLCVIGPPSAKKIFCPPIATRYFNINTVLPNIAKKVGKARQVTCGRSQVIGDTWQVWFFFFKTFYFYFTILTRWENQWWFNLEVAKSVCRLLVCCLYHRYWSEMESLSLVIFFCFNKKKYRITAVSKVWD